MLVRIFSGDVGKTAVKKVLKNYQKNVFSSVPFKKFELSNPPTDNYAKTDSAANISFVCFENFKIGRRASVVESYISKDMKNYLKKPTEKALTSNKSFWKFMKRFLQIKVSQEITI